MFFTIKDKAKGRITFPYFHISGPNSSIIVIGWCISEVNWIADSINLNRFDSFIGDLTILDIEPFFDPVLGSIDRVSCNEDCSQDNECLVHHN